jgi:hypothetical protein
VLRVHSIGDATRKDLASAFLEEAAFVLEKRFDGQKTVDAKLSLTQAPILPGHDKQGWDPASLGWRARPCLRDVLELHFKPASGLGSRA